MENQTTEKRVPLPRPGKDFDTAKHLYMEQFGSALVTNNYLLVALAGVVAGRRRASSPASSLPEHLISIVWRGLPSCRNITMPAMPDRCESSGSLFSVTAKTQMAGRCYRRLRVISGAPPPC